MPLPATKVIPDGWSEHHRPVANATMTGVADVTRSGGPGTFDRATGTTTPAARIDVALAQPVRVQRMPARVIPETVADQDVTAAHYLVTLPWPNATLLVDDLITLTACEDPALVGPPLTVTDVMKGTLLFERDVLCIDNQG